MIRLPGDFHRVPPAPLLLPSTRPGCLIRLGFSEKNQVTFLPRQGSCSLREERLLGPLGDERRAGRSGTRRGVPSSPECAGSAGEGRRRARQCHGSIFIPRSLFSAALSDSGGLDGRGTGCPGGVRKLT